MVVLPAIVYYLNLTGGVSDCSAATRVLEHGIETGILKRHIELAPAARPGDDHGHPISAGSTRAHLCQADEQAGFRRRNGYRQFPLRHPVFRSDALAEAAHATERKGIIALKEYQDDEHGSDGKNGSSDGHH